jgi:thiol-disulfide isomerase/thioredoxin
LKTPPIQPMPKSWVSGLRASGLSALGLIAVWGAVAFASALSTVDTRFPGLASGILRSARVADLPATVLLKADGIEIKDTEIDRMLQQAQPDLRPQLEKNRFYLLEQETARRVIVREAKAAPGIPANLSDADAVQRLFNQVAAKASVPESEARAFFDGNKHLFGNDPYDAVADTIRQVLLENKKEEAVQDYIRSLEKRLAMQVNGVWAKAQYATARDNPVDRARTSGKPSLIEFGASGCVPCDMMQPILDKLRKTHADRLNVVFVHVGQEKVLAARFGIRTIPVQAFYDLNGNEVFRHEGFFAEAEVNKVLDKMGVK